ncbi:MAG TPA: hypothetical protein VGE12_04305 [Noviherbaspirillum sp.]
MHRWLCTTAPLLIGSIAVGTIHAAPVGDGCPRKPAAPRSSATLRNAAVVALAAPHRHDASDPLRLCAGCHDGTVARVDVDLRADDALPLPLDGRTLPVSETRP